MNNAKQYAMAADAVLLAHNLLKDIDSTVSVMLLSQCHALVHISKQLDGTEEPMTDSDLQERVDELVYDIKNFIEE